MLAHAVAHLPRFWKCNSSQCSFHAKTEASVKRHMNKKHSTYVVRPTLILTAAEHAAKVDEQIKRCFPGVILPAVLTA